MPDERPALPDSIAAIGEQLERGDPVVPAPELFQDRGVFVAEFARIFLRPWSAAGHASRLDADGRFLRFEVGTRSVVVVREAEDRIHALRNACLHAGYRVCEAEDGTIDHLHCNYHDWEYALDGELTAPALTRRHDASRYRLASYPLRICRGIVLVDLSRENADSAAPEPDLPDWLAAAAPAGRARYSTSWNWKYLRNYLRSNPELVLGAPLEAPVVELGALGFLAIGTGAAALVRIDPKFQGASDFELTRLAVPGTAFAATDEAIARGLRDTGEAIAAAPGAWLGRDFYAWYWSLMA